MGWGCVVGAGGGGGSHHPNSSLHLALALPALFCIACGRLLALVLQRTQRRAIDPDELRGAIQAHLRVFSRLYGEEAMVPKFHYSLHLPDVLARWGWLPSCWVLERKHKNAKAWGEKLKDTSRDWHVSVLRELTAQHMALLKAHESYSCSTGLTT